MTNWKFLAVVLALSIALILFMPRGEARKCTGPVEALFWRCER